MTNNNHNGFTVGQTIVFTPRNDSMYSAQKGALARVTSLGVHGFPKMIGVRWLDRDAANGQMDGGYGPEDFQAIRLQSPEILTPQAQIVLSHLQQVPKGITPVEAGAIYRVRSLTKRISEIRKAGFEIDAQWKQDQTGQRYKRYRLVNENVAA